MEVIMTYFEWDIIFWLFFVSGQLMFMLKRADLARRSPLNGVPSIAAYFKTNWVIILQRLAFEVIFLFVYRYPGFPNELGLHFSLPVIKQSLVLSFFGGFFADALLDWATMQDSIIGIKVPKWVKESIPQLPQVQALVANLGPKSVTNGVNNV
jgi:hypothetical protein